MPHAEQGPQWDEALGASSRDVWSRIGAKRHLKRHRKRILRRGPKGKRHWSFCQRFLTHSAATLEHVESELFRQLHKPVFDKKKVSTFFNKKKHFEGGWQLIPSYSL